MQGLSRELVGDLGDKMNGHQNNKSRDLKKPCPGCMGRMINVFDLSSGMSGTSLLAGSDGSCVQRKQPDVVKKATNPIGAQIENKPNDNVKGRGSSREISARTSMKVLLAQEMPKEMESKPKPTNVVAELMGLEALPVRQSVVATQRLSHAYSCDTINEALHGCCQQEDGYLDSSMPCEIHSCTGRKNCKNVNGVKHLDTDGKLFQSREFQDALEVLSSNKDKFLRFPEEPNSLMSKHLHELHTTPHRSQKQCITLLKPSKTVESKGEKEVKKQFHPPQEEGMCETQTCHWNSKFTHPKAEKLSRLLVLKPSPGKAQNARIPFSPRSSPRSAEGKTDEATELGNEASFSVVPNGCVGDESSFGRLENEYMEEEDYNPSYSESATPTSQQSRDHTNRDDNSYSPSSFCRTSYSPDSSVTREAKKWILERWALAASNGIGQEQGKVRSSNSLGEILALSERKKEEDGDGMMAVSSRRSCDSEQDVRAQAACLFIGNCKDGRSGKNSSWNLSRSKSLPASPSAFENSFFNMEVSETDMARSESTKSSLKEKVSSLFFSRNRKGPGKEKCKTSSANFDDKFHCDSVEALGKINEKSLSTYEGQGEESSLINSFRKSKVASTSSVFNDRSKQCALTAKVALPPESSMTSNFCKNPDQPSPNSVLVAPFKDEVDNKTFQSCNDDHAGHLQLLSRSPPIESIARSLSWDDNHSEISSPNHLRTSLPEADEEGCEFVQKLLLSAGFGNEDPSTIFTRWHALYNPLDPILVDEFLDWNEERVKPKKRRSYRRLIFDCVSEALLDMGQNTVLGAFPWLGTPCTPWKGSKASSLLSEEVWGRVRDWFSGERKSVFCEIEDGCQLMDRVVKREVVGRGWSELMWLETDEFCKEIVKEALEELVAEALAELSLGCLH